MTIFQYTSMCVLYIEVLHIIIPFLDIIKTNLTFTNTVKTDLFQYALENSADTLGFISHINS